MIPSGARCGTHPETPAVDLCQRGEGPARGRRWVVAALLLATPLFLLMAALVTYGVFVTR